MTTERKVAIMTGAARGIGAATVRKVRGCRLRRRGDRYHPPEAAAALLAPACPRVCQL